MGGPPSFPQPGLVERSVDLLFPPVCVGCRRVGRWICARCWENVSWLNSASCFHCGRPSLSASCSSCFTQASFDLTLASCVFEGTAREAVHALKFHGRHAISAMMAKLMAEAARETKLDLVMPVPLHPSRRRERGYDQSAMLARRVAQTLGRPYQGRSLKRVRRTSQQANLSDAEARQNNVAGAFRMTQPLDGQTILLVDDVLTTGATMNAAAKALKEVGSGPVIALVFALASSSRSST